MNKTLLLILIVALTNVFVSAQSIKVMTYNIRYDTPADGVNQWPKRANKVVALIQKYDPDILGIQEALQHQVQDLVKNLPQYQFVGVGRDDGKTKGEFSAILYKSDRLTVLRQNTFWLSQTPDVPGSKDWDAAITRIASWAEFSDNKTKKTFMVINTHFDHKGKEARRQSAKILKAKATELAGQLPLVVTGDFNFTRDDVAFETMMNPQGLRLFDAAPDNPPGTSCGFTVNGSSCNGIDYIFYSPHWASSGYAVISDNDGNYYPSDHLPVLTTLTPK